MKRNQVRFETSVKRMLPGGVLEETFNKIKSLFWKILRSSQNPKVVELKEPLTKI